MLHNIGYVWNGPLYKSLNYVYPFLKRAIILVKNHGFSPDSSIVETIEFPQDIPTEESFFAPL